MSFNVGLSQSIRKETSFFHSERNDFVMSSRTRAVCWPRVVLASCEIRGPINKSIFLSLNICLVSANDVMEHFAFPGNIDFAVDDQGAFSWKAVLFIHHLRNNGCYENQDPRQNQSAKYIWSQITTVQRRSSVKQPKTIIGVRAPALPSFPTFYFHLRAFSMQRARLSRSLEQARATMSFTVSFVLQWTV